MRRNNYAKKRKLTKLFITFAAIAVIAYGASVYLGGRQSSNDVVVAKINNEKIYKSEIDSKLRDVFVGSDVDVQLPDLATFPPEVIETFAKEIYLEKELVARAKKSGLTKSDEIKNQIVNAQNRFIANAYLNSVIKEKVSEEKIRDKYAELNNNIVGKKEFAISQIVVKNESDAKKVREALNAKKSKNRLSFAEAAKKYSIDKNSAINGGKLGYVAEDSLSKEISEVTSKLKKGEISANIQTKNGLYIVKLEDVKEAKSVAFEDVKENLKEQMIKEETGAIYKEIFDNVKIEITLKKDEAKASEVKEEEKTQENIDEKTSENLPEAEPATIEVEAEPATKAAK